MARQRAAMRCIACVLALVALALTPNDATNGNAYIPRSYWRFENASNFWQDSQGNQPLTSFEGIGEGEVQVWRAESDGGIVGGWIDSTGGAINASLHKPPYYWERHMGTVPLDSCSKCHCNGTCSGSASVPGFTIEVLIKPNPVCFSSFFSVFSTFPPEPLHTSAARITGDGLMFEVEAANGQDAANTTASTEIEVPLSGVGVQATDYLLDGKWHHFGFVVDAGTGAQAIWLDGQSPSAFRSAGNSSKYRGKVIDNLNMFFNSRSGDATCAGVDELAIWEQPLPDSLIYQHWKDAFAHNQYSTVDPGVAPPTPTPTQGERDPEDYPPAAELPTVPHNATHGVSISAIDQLTSFPAPRYSTTSKLRPNFDWMAPPYLGGDGQPGVSTKTVTTRSEAIQHELVTHWNYALVMDGHGCCTDMQNKTISFANAHPEIGLTVVIMRIQEHTYLLNKSLPAGCYLQDAEGHNVNCAGDRTTKKILRPTTSELAAEVGCPDSVFDHDGEYFRDHVFAKMDALLTRPITIVNEDGEIFVSLGQNGKCAGDPRVAAAFQKLNESGSVKDWNTYASLWRLRLTEKFRDKFMVEAGFKSLQGAHYSEYQVQGTTSYFGNWTVTRQINTPWKLPDGTMQYYSTEDFYPEHPKWWLSGAGAWHGLEWIKLVRPSEIADKDRIFSPFVAAGWSPAIENNIRPGQWLGLLKILNAWGAEFFYTGFFSLGQPFPPVCNWIWQAAMPSYAQAVASLYADVLFGGKMLSFSVEAGSRPQIVRKHSAKPLYVVAVATQRMGNVKDSCKIVANVTVRVSNTTNEHWVGASDTAAWNITVEARLQGSVYLIDRSSPSSPKVVQLDGWHDHRHPYYWPKELVIEAELVHLMTSENAELDHVETERWSSVETALTDYGAFTSYVNLDERALVVDLGKLMRLDDAPPALQVWVRCRVADRHDGMKEQIGLISIADIVLPVALVEWQWLHAETALSRGYTLRVSTSGAACIHVDKIVVSDQERLPPVLQEM